MRIAEKVRIIVERELKTQVTLPHRTRASRRIMSTGYPSWVCRGLYGDYKGMDIGSSITMKEFIKKPNITWFYYQSRIELT